MLFATLQRLFRHEAASGIVLMLTSARTRRKNASLAPCAQHGASNIRVSLLL